MEYQQAWGEQQQDIYEQHYGLHHQQPQQLQAQQEQHGVHGNNGRHLDVDMQADEIAQPPQHLVWEGEGDESGDEDLLGVPVLHEALALEAFGAMQHPEQAQQQPEQEANQGEHISSNVLSFSDDDDEELDTTAEQVASGKDMQGIPWERLQFTRDHYRKTRLQQYRNYVNVLPENPEEYRPQLIQRCKQPQYGSCFYTFDHNSRAVASTIVHFQLRNLLWATSRNDIFAVCHNSVNHWNPITRQTTEVINLSGNGLKEARAPGVGKVQVSTLCVRDGLIATGGFAGELVVKRLGDEGWVYAGRISHSENGITNGLEIFTTPGQGPRVIASNNDALVRIYDIQSANFKCIAQWEFQFAVNYAAVQPSGQLVAVVSDDPVTCLMDIRSGSVASKLECHEDYSFAAAWHPHGHLLATGNQDTTTAVWDIRRLDAPLARLAGRMGAIRSLRWSPDGRYLAASEPADFVHLYDAANNFDTAQEIDLFGEISGISFTPAGDQLFVGIADITYASLLTFSRVRSGSAFIAHPQCIHQRPSTPFPPTLTPHVQVDA